MAFHYYNFLVSFNLGYVPLFSFNDFFQTKFFLRALFIERTSLEAAWWLPCGSLTCSSIPYAASKL